MREGARRELAFAWRDIRLAGTLHLPAGSPPFPAVLMMQGSGAADRDGNGYFPPIRDAFLSRGIAVYAFDKPGIGGSTGDWREYALYDRADQAEAAIALLREQPEIDPARIGIWGQSQGGWLVQILASRMPDLAFAVANSGAAIGVRAQDLAGCAHTMRAEGKDDEQIGRALAYLAALHAAAARGDEYATVERELIGPARDQSWYGYIDITDAEDWGMMRRFVAEGYEPAETIARIRCPFLAIFGALDVLVPAWESAQIGARALRDAGNTDATVVIFPDGNHRIQTSAGGPFCTGYLDLLGAWVAARVARR